MADATWDEGDRVLAPWEPQWLYPGTIRCIDDGVAFIKFDDGDRGLVALADLESIHVREGAQIFGRPNKGPKMYYPARVITALGEEIQIRFDDGREEWTSISYVRMSRGKTWLPASRN